MGKKIIIITIIIITIKMKISKKNSAFSKQEERNLEIIMNKSKIY